MPPLTHVALCAVAVALAVLLAAATPGLAQAEKQSPPWFIIMQGYVVADGTSSLTYTASRSACSEIGGTIASDIRIVNSNNVALQLATSAGIGSWTMLGGHSVMNNAQGMPCNTGTALEPKVECVYRYVEGLASGVQVEGQSTAGIPFYNGVFNYYNVDSHLQQFISPYTPPWDASAGAFTRPKGGRYLYGVATTNIILNRFDGMDNLVADMTFLPSVAKKNSRKLVCEIQHYLNRGVVTTTRPLQPPLVQGWKDLTWAQSHWWVIYLIIVIVVLVIVLITIYCAIRARKPPKMSDLQPMVMRERDGAAYVVEEDIVEKVRVKKRGTPYNPLYPPQPMMPMMAPMMAPPMPVDPSWSARQEPQVYSKEEVSVHSHSDSLAADAVNEVGMDEKDD